MSEVLFYHLDRWPLEHVLPRLLEKTLERGWRAVVQAGSPERVAALDSLLWTYRDDSFLPHSASRDDYSARQPVFLTELEENPNGAQIRFFVDGARAMSFVGYERLVHVFDGRYEDDLAAMRDVWTRARTDGHDTTYWRQDEGGRWNRQA